MSTLTIELDLVIGGAFAEALPLPARVLDPEGGLIAEAVVSAHQRAQVIIPPEYRLVFVRLALPSGRDDVKRVDVPPDSTVGVLFSDPGSKENEWSTWAASRLSKVEASLIQGQGKPGMPIDQFRDVWLRLWEFQSGTWTPQPVQPTEKYRNAAAKQVDFALPKNTCWCLQLGSDSVPWRMVSLPGGNCRVLLTPNESTDPRKEPLKVIVTGFRADVEAQLEFLARDSIRATRSLGNHALLSKPRADGLRDPVAWIAAAYVALRTGDAQSLQPAEWFGGFAAQLEWSSDAAVASCAWLVRRGTIDVEQANLLLLKCLAHGLPMFAEGLYLLQEVASLVRASSGSTAAHLRYIELMAAARAWAGSALSFYGARPDAPDPGKFVGLPDQPRRVGTEERFAGRGAQFFEFLTAGDNGRRVFEQRSDGTKSESLPTPSALFTLGDI